MLTLEFREAYGFVSEEVFVSRLYIDLSICEGKIVDLVEPVEFLFVVAVCVGLVFFE